MTTNWAGNITYGAREIVQARSIEHVQEIVAVADRVRALGSRHSFTDLTDTTGVLVSLDLVPLDPILDEGDRTVTVGAGATYRAVAAHLQERGWALANLASLPHISVAGAVATGTHGSGLRNGSLAAAVDALDIVGPDGSIRHLSRGDADFDGSVVALGALGVVVRATLDVEPTFMIRQDVLTGLSFSTLQSRFDELAGAAYSVSFFTRWAGDTLEQVWVKSRDLDAVPAFPGASPATRTMHMLQAGDPRAVTEQGGVTGPWLDRIPHFRMAFTPSLGVELQSEYLLPRTRAAEAIAALRGLAEPMSAVLQVGEIRTVAADRLWLSPSYGQDAVAFHFTWLRDTPGVYAVLPHLEEALLPLGARPHFGKCFVAGPDVLASRWEHWDDFADLRARVDPDGKFGNAFLDRVLGAPVSGGRLG